VSVAKLIGNLLDRPIGVLAGQIPESVEQYLISQFAKGHIESDLHAAFNCPTADAHLCRDYRCGSVEIIDKHQVCRGRDNVAIGWCVRIF
jgi:hypothetical protein